jgi:hypothetical protein
MSEKSKKGNKDMNFLRQLLGITRKISTTEKLADQTMKVLLLP